MLQSSQNVEGGREERDDGESNQAAGVVGDANPLDDRHDSIDCRPHVVGRHAPDQRIEFGRRRTYAQEKGYLDEDEDEAAGAGGEISMNRPLGCI